MVTQLQTAVGSNWRLLYQQHLYSVFSLSGGVRAQYERVPIPEFVIPVLPERHILAVRGDSDSANARWKTAGWLKQIYEVGGGSVLPNVQNASAWVPLRRAQMIEFPRRAPSYQLRFQVPWYLEDCQIKIWEYIGPEIDSTEQILTQLQASMRDLLGYPPE
jgi:hypothetical protein